MLHAMLYAGAVYLALLEGKSDSEESMFHLGKIIELVTRRLREERGNGVVEDGVIGALSCLALGEVGLFASTSKVMGWERANEWR